MFLHTRLLSILSSAIWSAHIPVSHTQACLPLQILVPRLANPTKPPALTQIRPLFGSPPRTISTTPRYANKNLPPRPKISEDEIDETFLKGSGPGGQKINKTNSAVQLKHLPTGVVVKSQATRSREQNRKIARQLLAEKLDGLEKGELSRVEIKRQREAKKKDRKKRKSRAKYLKLDEEKKKKEMLQEEGMGFDNEDGEDDENIDKVEGEQEGEEGGEEEMHQKIGKKDTTDL